ncbi:hypothetical protein Bca101_081649 [Brassica carinata]
MLLQTIPAAFFSKYIQGRNEQTAAKLRSDASKITWEVKIEDGRRLTDGWTAFALAHDLRIGDILIFRQEKDIIRSFVRANDLETRCGEILLVSEKGKSWTLALKQDLCGSTYIRGGWRSFCSVYTFKLTQRGRTPVIRLSSTDSELEEDTLEGDEVECLSTEPESDEGTKTNFEKIQRKKNLKRDAESSSLDHFCYVANVTPSSLLEDRLSLPKSFVRKNGLDTRCGEIFMINEKGTSWILNLKRKNSCGTMYIRGGWRRFCKVNGLRAGSFFTFKLIQRGGSPVLRLSSQFENKFVTLTLNPSNLTSNTLYLPIHFTRRHGINEKTKMTLSDKNSVKWFTNLRSEKIIDRVRLVGGWKEFFKANCVDMGESIILKLIRERDKSFSSKRVLEELAEKVVLRDSVGLDSRYEILETLHMVHRMLVR